MRLKQKAKHWHHHTKLSVDTIGRGRVLRAGLAVLILFVVFVPVFQQIAVQKSYGLSPETLKIVGDANQNLVKKFSYDVQRGIWQFNKDGTGAKAKANGVPGDVMKQLQAQMGGSGKQDNSLYSVDLAADPTQGITYYDNNTTLSFKMVPDFKLHAGREQQGRIVYPFGDGGKLVYTAKSNGMKEDLVLDHNIGDALTFSYKLTLPKELEARLNDDGSLGVYSADLALYSSTSASDSITTGNMTRARKEADKNHLLFAIPAPQIIGADGQRAAAMSRFQYNSLTNRLTVETSGLSKVSYPLSIDPSVVITSSSDFSTGGNNEGMISYDNNNEIDRGNFTGGSIGSWSSTATLPQQFERAGMTAYNGYAYVAGGEKRSPANAYNDVYYAPINSNGTLGSWTATTSLPSYNDEAGFVAYNGYMYYVGGIYSTTTAAVVYAPINSNGTLGSWNTTTSLPAARASAGVVAYGNYLYVIGGSQTGGGGSCGANSSCQNTVYYAPFKGDGTLGSWNTTTTFTNARALLTAVAYNDYLYLIGGGATGYYNDVQYASINADGTVGTWQTTSSFTTARYAHVSFVYNGYMYLLGGKAGSYYNDVQYASINADGTLSTWAATTSFTTARMYAGGIAYDGYVYIAYGWNGTNNYGDTQYAKIDPAGMSTDISTVTSTSVARNGAQSVTYNGYIYFMGGIQSTTYYATTYYASINVTTGAIGAWNSTATMNTASAFGGAGVWNGKVYIMGGLTTGNAAIDVVQYATINTNGTLGTWNTTTALPYTSGNHPGTIYNGYAYMSAGAGGGNGPTGGIVYAPINSNGTITSGAWANASSLNNSSSFGQMIAYGGYLYMVGGYNAGTYYDFVEYALINDNGSLGSWTVDNTGAMANARRYHGTVVVNGYMYAFGGEVSGPSDTATVEYAAINSNGSLGPWQSGTTMSTQRARFTIGQYGNFVYLFSGRTGGSSVATTSHMFVANSGGSSMAQSWATNSPSLSTPYPNGWVYGRMVAYQGFMYAVGGYTNPGTPTLYNQTYYAPINTDGTLGSWTATSSLNNARYSFGLVVYNDYIYAIAGHDTGSAVFANYEYAKLSPTGGLATGWTVGGTNLSTGRQDFAWAAYNGYVYIYGGITSGGVSLNDVNYASFNSNGTLSGWTNVANSFTTARRNVRGFAYNGYLYVIGGYDGTNYLSDIQYIALNGNGSLNGSWKYAGSLPAGRASFSVSVANGYVYVYGGTTNAGGRSDLLSAEIPVNGNIDNWATVNNFTTARNSSGFAVYNGVLYSAGGYSSTTGTYYTDIQTTHLMASARKAVYSKLIDLGTQSYISSISYNGNLPDSLKAIAYRVSDGAGVFGTLTLADNISIPSDTCAAAVSRYVWIQITLDDSSTGNAVMPDSASGEGNITDITINYTGAHPDPSVRLYGGKFFKDQVLQPHDICKP